jgi:hypothetical protein
MVDFSWLSSGWDLFKQKSGMWVGATFILGILTTLMVVAMLVPSGFASWYISLIQGATQSGNAGTMPQLPTSGVWTVYVGGFVINILYVVMVGGLFNMAMRQLDGQDAGVGDMFALRGAFLNLAGFGLLYACTSLVDRFTCGIAGIVFSGLSLFAPIIIVTRNAGPLAAVRESFGILRSQGLMAILFLFVGMLMISLSFLACGLGELITIPMFVLAVAVGYKSFTGSQFAQFQGYGPAQPGVWPPPPGSTPSYGQQPPYGEAPGSYGQQQPYGNPPGTPPPYGQPGQMPQPGWQQPVQPPQAPWQPPQQGAGQPPQGGGQWLGGEPQNDDSDNRA